MPTVGDVFQLKVFGISDVDTFLNVYHYQYLSGANPPNGAEALCDAFLDDLWPTLRPVLHQSCKITQLQCQNLDYAPEYFEQVLPLTAPYEGAYTTGENTPAFLCWTFKARRPYPPLRNGYKRLAGIPEELMYGSSPAPAAVPLLGSAATALGGNITGLSSGINGTFSPVVRYRVPGTETFSSWQIDTYVFARIGTQNTRKV